MAMGDWQKEVENRLTRLEGSETVNTMQEIESMVSEAKKSIEKQVSKVSEAMEAYEVGESKKEIERLVSEAKKYIEKQIAKIPPVKSN